MIGGGEECVKVSEEATAVFAVEEGGCEEVVQSWIELRVVQVAGCYQGEEACKGGNCE